MESKFTQIRAAAALAVTALASFLGWKGILALAWVACMAIDYISGTCAACKNGEWSSAMAREGLWHKGGAMLVVVTAAIGDLVMRVCCADLHLGLNWPDVLLPLVLAWYLITELGSILENAVKLGAAVPGWLTKLMQAGLKAVDAAAGEE